MDATITVRDFSGGLNTAVDESRLGAAFSASINNVEIMDSRTIRSRSGYQAISATAIRAGSEVKSLYKYYTKNGGKKWVALCGTAVFTAADVDRSTYGRVAVESLAATSATFAGPIFDGGNAVPLTSTSTTYSIPVPYSTDISLGWLGDSIRTRVDGGAWTTWVNGAQVSYSGLTATNHTLEVQNNASRSNTAMRLSPAGPGLYRIRERDITNYVQQFPAEHSEALSLKFYDDGTNNGEIRVSLRGSQNGLFPDSLTTLLSVGVRPQQSTSRYVLYVPSYYQTLNSNFARTQGWHTVSFVQRYRAFDVYLDNKYIAELPIFTPAPFGFHYGPWILRCEAASRRSDSAAFNGYFDEFRVDYNLIDDFNTLTNWSASSDSTDPTNDDAATTPFAANTGVFAAVDTITYQANPTWTRVASVSATADRLACVTYNDRLYFGTRYNALRYVTAAGTLATITASGAAPAADFVALKQNRIFALGKSSDRGLLEYSAVDAPNNWSGGGAIKPWGKDSGADATGLAKWNDALFIFGQNRTRALAIEGDDVNWVNKELSDQIGCIAPDTVVTTPNAILFLSAGGVRAYGLISGVTDTDGSGFLMVSENINPTLRRINMAAVKQACAAYWNNRYYLSVPLDDSTTNNVTFVYRLPESGQAGSWTKYDYGVRCMYVARGDEDALYGGGYDGKVYRLEYGASDAGSPISMHWRTPPLTDKTGYSTIKHWRRCHVGVQSDALMSLTVTPYSDDVNGQAQTVSVDASTDSRPVRFPLAARGRSLGVDFSSSGSEQSIIVSELTLTYVPGRMK